MLLIVMGIGMFSPGLDSCQTKVVAQSGIDYTLYTPTAGRNVIQPSYCRPNCSCGAGNGSCNQMPCTPCQTGGGGGGDFG